MACVAPEITIKYDISMSFKQVAMSSQKQAAFTIVELLIVIVVIAILAAISIVAYTGIQQRAHNTAVQSDLSSNAQKLKEYQITNGSYPTSMMEFRAAGMKFALSSHRHAVYCAKQDSNPADFAIVSYSEGGKSYVTRSDASVQTYGQVFDNTQSICARVGIVAPTTSSWLRGSGDWSGWVVY